MAISTSDPYAPPTTNQDLYKVPDLPSSFNYQNYNTVQNPYNQQSDPNSYALYNAYKQVAPTMTDQQLAPMIGWRNSRLNVTPLDQQLRDIAAAPQSQTYGRAGQEVDSELQSQLNDYIRQGQTARQTAAEQLNSLRPQYDTQRQSLYSGLQSYNTGLDNSLQQMLDDYNYSTQKVQSSINPAILAARESAARSGLLNSTVAIDRVNNALNPLTMQLGELAQKYQTGTMGAERQRQDYLSNYLGQLNNLGSKEAADVGNIDSRAALQYQQLADQASQLLGQRSNLINTRAGTYEDALRQFGLQQQQLQNQNSQYYAGLGEQQRQFNINNKV